MEGTDKCSGCEASPLFICLCSNKPFCTGDCYVTHLAEFYDQVHSTIPITKAEVLATGISSQEIIDRNSIAESINLLVHKRSAELDAFVEESSAKIRTQGDALIASISRIRDEKTEAIRAACEAAQGELLKLLSDIESPAQTGEVNRGYIMIDNILRRNLQLSDIKLTELSFTQQTDLGLFDNFATASVSFPSDELKSLRTDVPKSLPVKTAESMPVDENDPSVLSLFGDEFF
jgi:hypothetical protein